MQYQEPQDKHSAEAAAASFLGFMQRNGKTSLDLAQAIDYQAAQAGTGTQEITTPEQQATQAWAAQLAAERQARIRELATLIKD